VPIDVKFSRNAGAWKIRSNAFKACTRSQCGTGMSGHCGW
jgi:hypothetical protein